MDNYINKNKITQRYTTIFFSSKVEIMLYPIVKLDVRTQITFIMLISIFHFR
jgi:hypothetical protein